MSITLQSKKKNDLDSPFRRKTVYLFVAGVGAVGGTLVRQIAELNNPEVHIQILGLCNSKQVIWNPNQEDPFSDLIISNDITDWDQITDQLTSSDRESIIFVDATGSKAVAYQYAKLLSHGVHVATPSKRANTLDQIYFDELASFPRSGRAEYKYETAVGAGLPIINTVKNLVESGDEVTKISGVVSGTMTYIFDQLQQGVPFSKIITNAKELGYSEPDPRDDLSGEDVARKFLILARTCGYKLEREHINVESLVPQELIDHQIEGFFDHISFYDTHWKSRNSKALVNNRRLRYVGEFTPEGIDIGIKEVATESPLGNLKGTDNLIQIYTKRYSSSPIVIQGPGAGKDVTAAGVLSDILEIGKKC